jgi:hypothetical protein
MHSHWQNRHRPVMREEQGSKTSAHCNLKSQTRIRDWETAEVFTQDLSIARTARQGGGSGPSAGYSFKASKHTRHNRTGLGMLNFAIGSLFIEQDAHTSRPQCRQ